MHVARRDEVQATRGVSRVVVSCTIEAMQLLYWNVVLAVLWRLDTALSSESVQESRATELLLRLLWTHITIWVCAGLNHATRLAVFEGIFGGWQYESPRETRVVPPYKYSGAGIVIVVAWTLLLFSFVKPPGMNITEPDALNPLSPDSTAPRVLRNVGVSMLLWTVTDCFFYVQHRACHDIRWLYRNYHCVHHAANGGKPTAWAWMEQFHTLDAMLHMISYLLAAHLVFYMLGPDCVSRTLLTLGAVQWFVAGQFHHGGKDVPVALMYGLHPVMALCGVQKNMSLLHEEHHTKGRNYSMMGILDKALGTVARGEVC